MDSIYHKVRSKTNEGLVKIDDILKKQAHNLYFEWKADLHVLLKEKKKQEEINIETYMKKT